MSGEAIDLAPAPEAPADRGDDAAAGASLWSRPALVRIVVRVCRLVVGGIFLLAGYTKIMAPLAFVHAVYDYELLGPRAGLVLAAGLPWIEIFVGLLLVFGLMLPGASALATAFLAMFVGAQGWALWRDLAIDCGCFGFGAEPVSTATLLRTSILLVMASVVLWASLRGDATVA